MSVVEFNKQLRFIERVFYTYFCILVRDNYCGYSLDIDSMNEKINEFTQLFSEYEYAKDVFSTENNFTTFLIKKTHGKNIGFFNEEENIIFLLIGEQEIENTIKENEDILYLVDEIQKILETKKLVLAC